MPQYTNICFALKSILYHEKNVLQLIHCMHASSNYRELAMVSGMCFSSKRAMIEWIKLKTKFSLWFLLISHNSKLGFPALFLILSLLSSRFSDKNLLLVFGKQKGTQARQAKKQIKIKEDSHSIVPNFWRLLHKQICTHSSDKQTACSWISWF